LIERGAAGLEVAPAERRERSTICGVRGKPNWRASARMSSLPTTRRK
jgi:hypothetical protein